MTAWHTELELRDEYRDYLGHVTAAVHLKLFEHARDRWLAEIADNPMPSFVVARQELDYRRELLVEQGPVTVSVAPVRLTKSSVTISEKLSTDDAVHTESRAILVRWDRDRRRSMPFPPTERRNIEAQIESRPPAANQSVPADSHKDSGTRKG